MRNDVSLTLAQPLSIVLEKFQASEEALAELKHALHVSEVHQSPSLLKVPRPHGAGEQCGGVGVQGGWRVMDGLPGRDRERGDGSQAGQMERSPF